MHPWFYMLGAQLRQYFLVLTTYVLVENISTVYSRFLNVFKPLHFKKCVVLCYTLH